MELCSKDKGLACFPIWKISTKPPEMNLRGKRSASEITADIRAPQGWDKHWTIGWVFSNLYHDQIVQIFRREKKVGCPIRVKIFLKIYNRCELERKIVQTIFFIKGKKLNLFYYNRFSPNRFCKFLYSAPPVCGIKILNKYLGSPCPPNRHGTYSWRSTLLPISISYSGSHSLINPQSNQKKARQSLWNVIKVQ